jgi:hypothetical protein
MRLWIMSVLLLAPIFGAASAPKTHRDYRAIAAAAYDRKDYSAAKEAVLAALELLPSSPHYLYNLAGLSALTNDSATAYETLREVAAFGVTFPIERDRDLAKLQGAPEFLRLVRLFAANREPRGNADIVAELPGRTGILEGIAFRPRTGDLFLGDVHHRCIWRRDRDGQVFRFSAEDEELLGIFAVAVDEPRNTLWAVTTAVPEMAGFTADQKGHTGLAEFNLGTSELRRVIPLPGDGGDHGLDDLTVGPDGTVYTTDAKAPIVWVLAPGSEDFQKIADSPLFASLQGLVLVKGNLFVADYSNGLFKIEIATGEITELTPPKNTTLLGLDGLALVPGGIGATQNGIEPQRVVRIAFNADMSQVTAVTILAAALPHLTDLALITLINDRPTLIAGAGWEGFDPEKAKQPPAHPVRIFQVALP